MLTDFIQIIASKPGQFRDGLIVGNPDACQVFEGDDVPFAFDENAPSMTLDARKRDPRLIVVQSSYPFELAMLSPTETLESVTVNQQRAAFEFFASQTSNPLCTYTGFIPGGVSKIYVRAIEEDSNG